MHSIYFLKSFQVTYLLICKKYNDLPLCHGTSVRPSGLFPSVRNNPDGSFVTGVLAEAVFIIIMQRLTRRVSVIRMMNHRRERIAVNVN